MKCSDVATVAGHMHFFNNHKFEWFEYGAGSLGQALLYSEGNVHEAPPGSVCTRAARTRAHAATPSTGRRRSRSSAWSTRGLAINDAEIAVNQPAQVFDPHDE